jgi:hypothetical protein
VAGAIDDAATGAATDPHASERCTGRIGQGPRAG